MVNIHKNIHKPHDGASVAQSVGVAAAKPARASGRFYSLAAPLLPLAAAAAEKQPAAENAILFGNKWLALAVILLGVALFTGLVFALGRYLAATHPDSLNNTSK